MDINVSAYRTPAHNPNMIIFSQENKTKKFKYIELNKRGSQLTFCPLCSTTWKSYIYDTTYKEDHCHPNRRVVVSGFLWWKVLCPIYSVHIHYTCLKCKALFIYDVFNEKYIREVSM